MNIKTRGIVFHHIRYGDTSLITTVFTESSGRKSFLLKGVYRPKSLIKPGFFQPLSLLDMEISISPRRDLQRVKEISPSPVLQTLYNDIHKQSVVFFISEILYKTVREEEPNPALFEFLHYSVLYLDACENDVSNFHLIFLLQLSRYLGISPLNNFSADHVFFDALNGCFITESEHNEYTCSKHISAHLNQLMNLNFETSHQLSVNRLERVELLEVFIEYYGIHLHTRLNIQSLQVLKELFQ